jgi:substrate import-associated zinc metallohydrolase lipoprotein
MKKYIIFLFALILTVSFTSCNNDDPSSTSIFNATTSKDSLDLWLLKNYTNPYNVSFKYKWEDIESDLTYNLVPADSAKAAKLAILVKYLWFDAYSEVAGEDFVKSNVPRIIFCVGSAAWNSDHTELLGTAEGGLKITLYNVNSLTDVMLENYSTMNEYYFHTMHHEFTHILNQKKPYNTAFNQITESGYVSGNWYQYGSWGAHQAGFITPYAMDEGKEDFAEMLSTYVTTSESDWDAILNDAGTNGAALITEKLDIVRSYMKDSWNIDIDDVRDVVLRRASEISKLDLNRLN